MTQTTLKPIVLSILLISTPILSQAHETEQSVDLDEVTVVGKSRPRAICHNFLPYPNQVAERLFRFHLNLDTS